MGLMKRVLTESPASVEPQQRQRTQQPVPKEIPRDAVHSKENRPAAADERQLDGADAVGEIVDEKSRYRSRTGGPPNSGNPVQTAPTDAVSHTSDDEAENEPPIVPEKATQNILHELQTLPETIEAPAHIFSILKRNIEIRKGALLLPDPDERMFVPWTVTGFDMTTERRLHIPESVAGKLFSTTAQRMEFLRGNERSRFRDYLSNRELAVLNALALAPFFYEGRLLAILVIADSPFFAFDEAILRVVYSAFAGPVAGILYRFREERMLRIQQPLLFSGEQLLPMANEAVSAAAETEPKLAFLVFDPAPIVEAIGQFSEETDAYRIRQDYLRILNTLLAGLGRVFVTQENHMILMYDEANDAAGPIDVELLVHQVTNRMRDIFGRSAIPDLVQCRVVRFPEDDLDLEELVAGL